MQDDRSIIVSNWLSKSEESINSTKKAINIDELAMAQNRLYYSIFYAIMAIARYNNFSTSKHSQLMGWFNKEFVKSKKIDIKYSQLYKKAFENSQRCDYTFSYKPDKQILIEDLSLAENFIDEIKSLII